LLFAFPGYRIKAIVKLKFFKYLFHCQPELRHDFLAGIIVRFVNKPSARDAAASIAGTNRLAPSPGNHAQTGLFLQPHTDVASLFTLDANGEIENSRLAPDQHRPNDFEKLAFGHRTAVNFQIHLDYGVDRLGVDAENGGA